MKTFITVCLIIFQTYALTAQDWLALGDGTGTNNEVVTIAEYQGNIIAGGRFITAGGLTVNRIARWDGTTWHAMGSGFDNDVRSLIVFNGELIAGGIFRNDGTGTVPFAGMAKWNGTQWATMPVPDPLTFDYRDFHVFNGDLYATKHTSNPAFTVQVAKFDGSVWTDLPGIFSGPTNYVYLYSLGDYQGKLLAGGVFDSVNGVEAQRLALFNGSSWESLEFPVPGESGGILEGKVHTLAVFEGKLFAGGIFANFQDTIFGSSVASYDGTGWTAYPFDANLGATVYDFEVFDNRLLATGDLGFFQGSTIVTTVVMFDSTSPNHWTSLNCYNPLMGEHMKGNGMAIAGGELYLGGRFDYIGSSNLPKHNVARFNGDIPTGLWDRPERSTGLLYPNPASEMVFLNGTVLGDEKTDAITLFDISGRIVYQYRGNPGKIEVSGLTPGMYTLVIDQSGGQRIVDRFIKSLK